MSYRENGQTGGHTDIKDDRINCSGEHLMKEHVETTLGENTVNISYY